MDVYEPLVAEGFEWINCCDDANYESFLALDGSRQGKRWRMVKVRRVRADDGQGFNSSDFPWLGAHALVLRSRAVDMLRDMLNAHGEVLPLATEDEVGLFVFNAYSVDALDEEHSNIMRFPRTNRIMRVMKIEFIGAAIRNVDIFRLSHRASSTYVSRRFVDRVEKTGLVGIEFRKVWSSKL